MHLKVQFIRMQFNNEKSSINNNNNKFHMTMLINVGQVQIHSANITIEIILSYYQKVY